MASNLINFVVDNFLSKFIEIDKSQTYASLWSGVLELKNLKIKKESFSYINLPYFVLESGYIGKIRIEIKMPFFYSNPIIIVINDIFILAKQKDINHLKDEEEKKAMKDLKNKKLISDEEIFNKLEEIENQEPTIFSQILNNINININNFVLRFEDSISNPVIPFSFGMILKKLRINSSNEEFEILIDDNIKNEGKENNNLDFIYKLISINDLFVYLDCFNSLEDLNYNKLIDISIKDNIPSEMVNYLGDIFNFYCYCQSELNINYNNKLLHDFILYKLNIEIKISMNFNLENNNPKYELYIDEIDNFIFQLNINQLSNAFLLLSYYNLFNYYQLGLSRSLFNNKIEDNEKSKYILDYMSYYYKKYKIKSTENLDNKKFFFQKIDEKLDYDEIKKLRKIATNNLYLYIKEKEIEEKINAENNKWFFTPDVNSIKELNIELANVKNQLIEQIKYEQNDTYNFLFSEKENDNYSNLPDNFIFNKAKLKIKKLHFEIFDITKNTNNSNNLKINNDNDINKYNKLLDFYIEDMTILYITKKYNSSYSLYIKNFILSQNIVKSNEYDKIIIAKSNKDEEQIIIEYQTNKDDLGNIINKVIFNTRMQIILFINLYVIQYINNNILSCLSNFISFIEMSGYTDDNINKYLQLGYIINEYNKEQKKIKQNNEFTTKFDYDINLNNPIIIIPQDILDLDNKKCLVITAEDLIIKSDLINEGSMHTNTLLTKENNNLDESNSNYESCLNDSNILDNIYDKQILSINGIQLYLSNNCVKEDNYKTNENILVHYFNLSVMYKTLINLNDKNKIYNNSCLIVNIKDLYFSIDEFQILFLLTYLKEMKYQNELLKENSNKNSNNVNDKIMEKYNKEYIQNFIKKMESKGIILKDEFKFENSNSNNNNNININNESKIIKEDDFYKNSNKSFLEVNINEIKFVIYKIYPDLTKANFIQLKLDKIQMIKLNDLFDNGLLKLNLKDISLINKEQDIKKNFLLPKEFQLLMKNEDETINCISYSSLYIKNINENITNIEINNIDILSSFETLTRLYTFSMYYFGKYQDIQYDEQNNKNINVTLQRDTKHKNENSILKQEKITNQNILKFKLINSFLRIPIDEKDVKKPIFSTRLNIFYEQSNNEERQNLYDINNKTLLKTKLLYNNKTMNLIICESYFDIIYFYPSHKGIKTDKIISNYRIQYTSKYTYFLSKKNSISTMNILVEPLIITIDLYQLKHSLNFYNDMMKFLSESLSSNYVPYLKPEDVIIINGKSIVIQKKKSLVKIIRQVILLNKLKKKIYRLFEIRKKKKNINELLTNSFNSIDFQLDKIYITILDNNKRKEKRILLALQLSKIFFNKINNSNPNDKKNVGNELFSIISNSYLSIDSYTIHNLFKYMNCTLTLELFYYNLEYSEFENLIEPVNIQYLSYQVDNLFRNKTYINIENIININVSTSSIKVLNIFLSKYTKNINDNNKKENENEINTNSNRINLNYLRLSNGINVEEQEEIVIKLINKTGLFIYFWFDFDKDNKIKINNKEVVNLTDKLIYKTRKNKKIIQKKGPEKNTFSFKVLNYESIQHINYNRTNSLYFKTKIKDDINDQKYLFYNIKINTSSLIKEIIFDSSITILNETIYDELLLSIDDNIEDNNIILSKNKKAYIPLTWVISSKNIFLQKNKTSEKVLIYNDISEIIFSDKLSQLELKEKGKAIEKTRTLLEDKLNNYQKINLHHPKYKDYISTFLLQRFNKKNSKIVTIKENNNEIISFYLDYCSLTNKDYEITSENNNNNSKLNKYNEKVYQFLEYTTKSLEYMAIIRPIINFTNYTPFEITILNNNENSNIILNKMKTIELYNDIWLNNNSLIKFILTYNNENYETDFININNNNYINTINLSNNKNKILRFNIAHNLLTKNFNIFENELEQYSILSYDYVIFFDFLVNNRLGFDLYGIDIKDLKNIENNVVKFNNDSLSVVSCNKEDIQSLLISSNEDNFNKKNKVNINAIDIENLIKIEEDKIIHNILCKASNSINYKYSNILLFEPKYILVNDLDLNIYIQQINENNKPVDEIKKVISKKYIPLTYRNEKKIIFKIGIKGSKKSPLISYSGLFELDNLMEYDLKVEIDDTYKNKYQKNIFYMSKKMYLYFRVKNKTTDEGNIYIFITLPEFPILEIDNRTNEQIKIYETKKDEPIIINPISKIPFVWKNNVILKNKFICEILNKQKVLSFSDYKKTRMNIKNNRNIDIYNHQKNSLTGTRCIIFEEVKLSNKLKIEKKKNFFEDIINRKNLKALSKINIFIKGIGLSFLDEVPKEIFYISFYEIRLLYSNTFLPSIKTTNEYHEKFEFYLKNFQIDSSLNNSLKTLIYPKNQNIPSLETEDSNDEEDINFIALSVEKRSISNISKEVQSVRYSNIDLCIQEITIKIDQVIIMNLINLIKNYTSKLDYFQTSNIKSEDITEEENLLKNIKIPFKELKSEKQNSNKILINYLFLSAIKINLSFRLDLSSLNISPLPKIISNIIGSFGSSLVRISDSPIKFSEKVIENIYMEIGEIANIFIKSYIKESIFQILTILGSSDIIGNPVQLVEKIGTGFFEFVNEPRKGLLKGPSQFGKGIAKGVAGLLNGVVGGTFDSVSRISGTLYSLVQSLTGKNNDLIIEDDENEPSNILTGASKGLMDGFQELYKGFTGLIFSPIERNANSGSNPLNFFKDLGIGLVGFAVSPVNFVLKIGNSIAVGTKNTFNYFYNKKIKNQRFRFPRYIQENTPLTIYDPDLSAAKEFLYKLLKIEDPIILYFSQFYCENKGYYGKIAYLLLTKELLLLMSNEYEIILNINIIDIKDIELKYNGTNFEFIIILNENESKAILINKISNVFACELYCALENRLNIKKDIIKKSISFTRPYVQKFKSALKENIKNKKMRIKERKNSHQDNIIENNNSMYYVNENEISEEDSKKDNE